MTMLAFHGRPCIKKALLTKLAEHKKLDEFTQGFYHTRYRAKDGSDRFKGCAVGCTIIETVDTDSGACRAQYLHHLYERYYGIPCGLALLEDALFELLPEGSPTVKKWPIDFIEAITPGACLENVRNEILRNLILRKNFKKAIYACVTDGDIFYREIGTTKDVGATLADWPMRVFRTDRDTNHHALVNLRYATYFPDTVFALARIAFNKPSDAACAKDVAKIVLSILRAQKPKKKKFTMKDICASVAQTNTDLSEYVNVPLRYRPVLPSVYAQYLESVHGPA